jgi:hypothetical protein
MNIDDIQVRIKEISALGDRRHAEQGRTGVVHLNELLTPDEQTELSKLLMQIPSVKSSDVKLVKSV